MVLKIWNKNQVYPKNHKNSLLSNHHYCYRRGSVQTTFDLLWYLQIHLIIYDKWKRNSETVENVLQFGMNSFTNRVLIMFFPLPIKSILIGSYKDFLMNKKKPQIQLPLPHFQTFTSKFTTCMSVPESMTNDMISNLKFKYSNHGSIVHVLPAY